MIQMEINRNLMIVGVLAFVLVFVEVGRAAVHLGRAHVSISRASALSPLWDFSVIFVSAIATFERVLAALSIINSYLALFGSSPLLSVCSTVCTYSNLRAIELDGSSPPSDMKCSQR